VIQVCSSCSTRWNVRDKQRAWCPRCQGRLLPPDESAAPPSGWSRPAGPPPGTPTAGGAPVPSAGQLPPGYRWIAVRPGSPPPPKPRRRPWGPPPRYDVIPRWSLQDMVPPELTPVTSPAPTGPAPEAVERLLRVTMVLLGAAAGAYLLRYILLLVNRTMLLNSWVAAGAVILAVALSVAALAATVMTWVTMTRWLIARRAAVYAHQGVEDPRPVASLWIGCMVPLVNLFLAPVYVWETAVAEGVLTRMRRDIVAWWVLWALSAATAAFSTLSLFSYHWFGVSVALTAQGVANNTVATIVGYLTAIAALLALARVYRAFQAKPVERPAHRWIVVADRDAEGGRETPPAAADSAPPVETDDREPAA
jgi:hypothetical protein